MSQSSWGEVGGWACAKAECQHNGGVQWGTNRHQVEGQREQGGTSWKKQWTPEEWTGSGWTFGAQSCLQLLTADKPSQGSAAVQGLWACPPWLRLAKNRQRRAQAVLWTSRGATSWGSNGTRQWPDRFAVQKGERGSLLVRQCVADSQHAWAAPGRWRASRGVAHTRHPGDAAPSLPAPRACPTVHGARPSVDPVSGLGVDCDAGGHHKARWKHRALHGTRQQLTHQLSEPAVAGCCDHPRQGQVIQQAVDRGCSTRD